MCRCGCIAGVDVHITTPPTQRRMRRSSIGKVTLPAFASWANLLDSNSDSNVCDDLSPDGLSLRVVELENALCNQDKLLCRVFREKKRLNLELENSFSEISYLRSVHNDMSAKPSDNCTMIMVNYADLWLVHS
jgi:hypothetical protein